MRRPFRGADRIAGASLYVASKRAVEGLTNSAALEGVARKRSGRRKEIADTIPFVASDRARFLTGEIIRLNGGRTAL
jgi:NAD(P)-dependent dehydrogenase (short-subunit alcohol dehydrogenase family)